MMDLKSELLNYLSAKQRHYIGLNDDKARTIAEIETIIRNKFNFEKIEKIEVEIDNPKKAEILNVKIYFFRDIQNSKFCIEKRQVKEISITEEDFYKFYAKEIEKKTLNRIYKKLLEHLAMFDLDFLSDKRNFKFIESEIEKVIRLNIEFDRYGFNFDHIPEIKARIREVTIDEVFPFYVSCVFDNQYKAGFYFSLFDYERNRHFYLAKIEREQKRNEKR